MKDLGYGDVSCDNCSCNRGYKYFRGTVPTSVVWKQGTSVVG